MSPQPSGFEEQAKKESSAKQVADPEYGEMFLPKRRLTFERITRGYIPGDNTLHNHLSENLKSYEFIF
jgi:hypothetical protein